MQRDPNKNIVPEIKLNPRLRTAFDMVKPGAKVADIGADHAYLATALVLSGKCPSAVAADINPMPLKNAESALNLYNLCDKIELRISDGLKSIRSGEAEVIAICGMGGDLIVKIIDEASWLKNSAVQMVLQPMTRAEKLRKYLLENGFEIDDERVAKDRGRMYVVMSAHYSGNVVKSDAIIYNFGKLLNKKDKLSGEYCKAHADKLIRSFEGMKLAADKPESFDELKELVTQLRKYIK